MLILKNISFKYKNSNSYIFKDFSYQFKDNGIYFLYGESGKGKTTLLNLISQNLKLTSGSIIYNNNVINEKEEQQFTKNVVSYFSQDNNLINALTIKENIKVFSKLFNFEYNKEEILDYFKKFGLDETFLKRFPKELSGGEKQRISIVLALLKKSKIILFDEPTASLDDNNSLILFQYLKTLSKTHLIIISTHNILLNKDNIYPSISLDDLKNEPLDLNISPSNNETNCKTKGKPFDFLYFSWKLLLRNFKKFFISFFTLILSFILIFSSSSALDFSNSKLSIKENLHNENITEFVISKKDNDYENILNPYDVYFDEFEEDEIDQIKATFDAKDINFASYFSSIKNYDGSGNTFKYLISGISSIFETKEIIGNIPSNNPDDDIIEVVLSDSELMSLGYDVNRDLTEEELLEFINIEIPYYQLPWFLKDKKCVVSGFYFGEDFSSLDKNKTGDVLYNYGFVYFSPLTSLIVTNETFNELSSQYDLPCNAVFINNTEENNVLANDLLTKIEGLSIYNQTAYFSSFYENFITNNISIFLIVFAILFTISILMLYFSVKNLFKNNYASLKILSLNGISKFKTFEIFSSLFLIYFLSIFIISSLIFITLFLYINNFLLGYFHLSSFFLNFPYLIILLLFIILILSSLFISLIFLKNILKK